MIDYEVHLGLYIIPQQTGTKSILSNFKIRLFLSFHSMRFPELFGTDDRHPGLFWLELGQSHLSTGESICIRRAIIRTITPNRHV